MSSASLRPAYHRADPDTSRQAAESITLERSISAQVVAAAVRSFPGRTSNELAHLIHQDRHAVAKRLPDARQLGLVEQGLPRKCHISGRNAMTWLPVERNSPRSHREH